MRKVTEGDTTYVYTRAEDRSVWMKISCLIDKYKPLVWLIFALALALGFGFKTPAQRDEETKIKIDSLALRTTRLEQYMEATQRNLNTLVRLRCLDVQTEMSKAATRASGLNCGVDNVP